MTSAIRCRAFRHKSPCPSPFVKQRAAAAASCRFLELPAQLVGVMLIFLDGPVPTWSMTGRAFHFASHCFTFPRNGTSSRCRHRCPSAFNVSHPFRTADAVRPQTARPELILRRRCPQSASGRFLSSNNGFLHTSCRPATAMLCLWRSARPRLNRSFQRWEANPQGRHEHEHTTDPE